MTKSGGLNWSNKLIEPSDCRHVNFQIHETCLCNGWSTQLAASEFWVRVIEVVRNWCKWFSWITRAHVASEAQACMWNNLTWFYHILKWFHQSSSKTSRPYKLYMTFLLHNSRHKSHSLMPTCRTYFSGYPTIYIQLTLSADKVVLSINSAWYFIKCYPMDRWTQSAAKSQIF